MKKISGGGDHEEDQRKDVGQIAHARGVLRKFHITANGIASQYIPVPVRSRQSLHSARTGAAGLRNPGDDQCGQIYKAEILAHLRTADARPLLGKGLDLLDKGVHMFLIGIVSVAVIGSEALQFQKDLRIIVLRKALCRQRHKSRGIAAAHAGFLPGAGDVERASGNSDDGICVPCRGSSACRLARLSASAGCAVRTLRQRVVLHHTVKRFLGVDGDRIADLLVHGLQNCDLGDAFGRRLRHPPLHKIQQVQGLRNREDSDAVLLQKRVKRTAALRRTHTGQRCRCRKILFCEAEHGDQPYVHKSLSVIIVVHGCLHVRRGHAQAGQKADGQKTHHKKRQKALFRMQDFAHHIGDQSASRHNNSFDLYFLKITNLLKT